MWEFGDYYGFRITRAGRDVYAEDSLVFDSILRRAPERMSFTILLPSGGTDTRASERLVRDELKVSSIIVATDPHTHRMVECLGRGMRGVQRGCDGRALFAYVDGTFDVGPGGFVWHGENNVSVAAKGSKRVPCPQLCPVSRSAGASNRFNPLFPFVTLNVGNLTFTWLLLGHILYFC